MSQNEEWLSQATQERVKPFHNHKPLLTPILKGGSDRSFHRAQTTDNLSCIVMHYSKEKEENHYYVEIGTFLRDLGIPVPEILGHDPEKRVVWLEDLGGADLYSMRDWKWEDRKEGYKLALSAARRLHDQGLSAIQDRSVRLMPGFDETLYAWERNYFLIQFVEGLCGVHPTSEHLIGLEDELQALAVRLGEESPCLVHRDFQSQNIMIREGKAFLIDFQGMRLGNRFYDLGSLLFDPYVPFDESQQIELLRYYDSLGESGDWEAFLTSFYEASIQRLMQALGAYGFLSRHKGKTHFLQYVPSGLKNLKIAAMRAGSVPQLVKLVDYCIENRIQKG
jgi:aminoglycoside/choline kinase family phosphotransferase